MENKYGVAFKDMTPNEFEFVIVENKIEDLMSMDIPELWSKLDNKLFTLLQYRVLNKEFIQNYKPHIIMFGDFSFLDCVKIDKEHNKWVVFNIWNCKKEYLKLYQKLLNMDSYNKEYIGGFNSMFTPIPKSLFNLGIKDVEKECDRVFDSIVQLYSCLRPEWMTEYRNSRCFRVLESQKLIQVSFSKIAKVEGLEDNYPEDSFTEFTPTLSDSDYNRLYGF